MSHSPEEFTWRRCSNELEGRQGQGGLTGWRTQKSLVPDPFLSGDVVVPVANCGVREYNSNPKEHMTLRDYISYWKEYNKKEISIYNALHPQK